MAVANRMFSMRLGINEAQIICNLFWVPGNFCIDFGPLTRIGDLKFLGRPTRFEGSSLEIAQAIPILLLPYHHPLPLPSCRHVLKTLELKLSRSTSPEE